MEISPIGERVIGWNGRSPAEVRHDTMDERPDKQSYSDWSSPRKVDSQLRVFGLFVLRRGDVPQRGVTTLDVVEDLDVLEDRGPGLRSRGEVRAVDQFLLQRCEK